jgi:subtilase family serine protease
MVPDVAAFADELPGYLVFVNGVWDAVGGTSAATPLTAAAMALQSTVTRACSKPALGFSAPLLYSISAADVDSMEPVIVDVTQGTNDPYDVGAYSAGRGYDLASGLGWVRHDRLRERLTAECEVEPLTPKFTG